MATILDHPRAVPPVAAVARILGQFERDQLAGFIEVAIELLDVLDGDPDSEGCGDEEDGSLNAEDEFMYLPSDGYPGCPVSDPGGCEHDGRESEDGC